MRDSLRSMVTLKLKREATVSQALVTVDVADEEVVHGKILQVQVVADGGAAVIIAHVYPRIHNAAELQRAEYIEQRKVELADVEREHLVRIFGMWPFTATDCSALISARL